MPNHETSRSAKFQKFHYLRAVQWDLVIRRAPRKVFVRSSFDGSIGNDGTNDKIFFTYPGDTVFNLLVTATEGSSTVFR